MKLIIYFCSHAKVHSLQCRPQKLTCIAGALAHDATHHHVSITCSVILEQQLCLPEPVAGNAGCQVCRPAVSCQCIAKTSHPRLHGMS